MIYARRTEQEGFEPPLPFGKTVFKTVAFKKYKSHENKVLQEAQSTAYKLAYKEKTKKERKIVSVHT